MEKGMIRLNSGSSVAIDRFEAWQPRRTTLEGQPATIRKLLIADHRKAGYFLYEPPPEVLPNFLFTASLTRDEPTDSEHRSSSLVVCWFDDELPRNLHSAIAWRVRDIDWDKHAEFLSSSPDFPD